MATIPTQNAVPSEAPRDLKFNSGKIDEFVTSLEHEYKDRFGRCHMTIEGMRWIFEQLMARFKVDINQAIIAAGYIPMDSFQQGAEITKRNEILRDETTGEYYRWDGDLPKSVPVGSTPESAGGVGIGAWVGVGDASVRQDLEIVKRRMSVKSMSDFFLLECKDKETAILISFYPGRNRGGGIFVYNSEEPRSNHNGVTIISPDVEFTDIESWLAVDPSRSGAGCWVKQIVNNTITSDECGCVPDGDSPVELPYFEKLSDIQKMKSYIPGDTNHVATNNSPMLQSMLDLPIYNKHITAGNYSVSSPLEYSDNSNIFGSGYKTFLYASTSFDESNLDGIFVSLFVPKQRDNQMKESVTFSNFYTEGQYRYYTWDYLAKHRAWQQGGSNGQEQVVPKKIWSAINDFGYRQMNIENVGAAFWRYFNMSGASTGTYIKSCKSWYMWDDGYTSSHEENDNKYPTWGSNHHYEDCEAWFAGFGSGNGSGFEIDDGPDNAYYENCRSYFCPTGFNQHVHDYMDNVPHRKNYLYLNCKVYSPYVDRTYHSSTDAYSNNFGGFTMGVGGQKLGVSNITLDNCYTENNPYFDVLCYVAQKSATNKTSNIRCVNFSSKIDDNLKSVIGSDFINDFSPSCIQIYFESTGGSSGSHNISFEGQNLFDGGGFKKAINSLYANDLYFSENTIFDKIISAGRITGNQSPQSPTGIPNRLVFHGKIQRVSDEYTKNANCLVVSHFNYCDFSNSAWDFTGDNTFHTAINVNAGVVKSIKLTGALFINGGKILALNGGQAINLIVRENTFEGMRRAVSYGTSNIIGGATDNILINTSWASG
ncbi:tail fiber/spike domain-containing protein [Morganella morganii]|uniref:tail fiber/spike domain-containing protein n=1 Tax=Morganella morganii TaxID=582 RepID=UPI00388EE11D